MKHIFSDKKGFVIAALLVMAVFCFALQAAEYEVITTIPVDTTLDARGTKNAAETWTAMINGAEKTLDFAQFYLSTKTGEPLEPVIAAIIKAAKRGVRVRFLVGTPINDDMKARTRQVLDRFAGLDHITVATFDWKTLTRGILHAKYFIVDGREVFVGSQNFDWRSLKHIHETGLRIRDKGVISALGRIFEADWQYHRGCNRGDKDAYKKMKQQAPVVFSGGNYLVATPEAYNPPGVESALTVLVRLLDGARKSVTIQLLDYKEDIYGKEEKFTTISGALTRAAGRGVKIRMLVSDWNKREPRVDALKRLVQVPNIDIRFAAIPQRPDEFIPYARVIHSKVMRIDGEISWVGTSNWGYGYFYNSRNVEVVTGDAAVGKKLDGLFQQLWSSEYTEPVDPKKEYTPPRRY